MFSRDKKFTMLTAVFCLSTNCLEFLLAMTLSNNKHVLEGKQWKVTVLKSVVCIYFLRRNAAL